MMAYFAALQNNMFQQQHQVNPLGLTSTPSSSASSNTPSNPNQISPFSLLQQQQQQQQQKNPFMLQQPGFNALDQTSPTSTAAILAAAMAAIAQGGVDPNNMSQLLPHLLQTMQHQQHQQSAPSITTSANSKAPQPPASANNKVQDSNYNSNLLSPSSSSSSHSYRHDQPQAKKQKLSSNSNGNNSDSLLVKACQMEQMDVSDAGQSGEKEARNFLCYWCDFRGRWRSEIIQHMRCHHAREKPYRCSACMYASNWKWDVQKHTKKQHPNNQNAKIVEISDQILFPDLKDMNFFENVKPTLLNSSTPDSVKKIPSALNLTPPNSSSASSTSSSSSSSSLNSKPVKTHENRGRPKSKHNQPHQPLSRSHEAAAAPVQNKPASKHHSLCCQQCPYVACNLSDLRRHLIVHSNEQPYHCCSCDFKSKWKSDVKKHQRSVGHVGPILVGKKAMQKVIENLGLDKNSMVTLYGPNIQVIDNKQCKSNEKLIDEDNIQFRESGVTFQKNKSNKFVSRSKCDAESSSLKRKHAESDCEEFEEQHYDEEEDYEQLNEGEEIDDEYEQVLAYNNNNGHYADEELDDEDEQLIEPLNEEYDENQDEMNSQFTDDNNNCDEGLMEHNLNELGEEIDC